jgi:hypothetical protein
MKADGIGGNERALVDIEKLMREIGVDLLSDVTHGLETAAATRIRQHSQTSVLSNIAGSLSIGLQAVLTECMRWDTISGECNVELNQDYLDAGADQALLGELNKMHREKQISDKIYFWNLRRMELLPPELSFEEFMDERETDKPVLLSMPKVPIQAVPPVQQAPQRLPGGVIPADSGALRQKNGRDVPPVR